MSALFDKGREYYLAPWLTDDVRAMLVRSTYTFDAADQFVADLGAVDNGRSASLGSKTATSGTADAADIAVTATAAVACNKVIMFVHTGNDATARLISCTDVNEFTPSAGQVVTLQFNNGAEKIFKL